MSVWARFFSFHIQFHWFHRYVIKQLIYDTSFSVNSGHTNTVDGKTSSTISYSHTSTFHIHLFSTNYYVYRRFRFCVLCKHSSTLLIHSPRTSNKDRSHILCTSVYFFFSGWVCMSSLDRRNAEQITLSKMVGRSRFSDVPIIAIKSLHYSAFPPQYF